MEPINVNIAREVALPIEKVKRFRLPKAEETGLTPDSREDAHPVIDLLKIEKENIPVLRDRRRAEPFSFKLVYSFSMGSIFTLFILL